ncbi:secreted RxLR effector protein 161-like [Rhodamnia argentea]|uniref:Secreted RxLR effector protein 161-like n=1 Tax=Rhodamnia argentea TaxID=178133 RepID=A0ABM3GVR2_9MYRT|nr:secreted RxLR effector protein 161-like [Rhodamnia argentea]
MDAEIKAIKKNGTWELTDLPEGQKTIVVKWVYKTKMNKNGEIEKYKALRGKRLQAGIWSGLQRATRPDIMHPVSLISSYMENPTEKYLQATKRILRYLRGIATFGLFYKKGEKSELLGFTDSDYAGDMDDRKSTSGYVFMLGSGAVSWCSKKQPIVTLSTIEAEFVATTSSACQAFWLRKVL